MKIQHLANTATIEETIEVVREHGHVIIDALVLVGAGPSRDEEK